ncbi:MAG: arginine--tRNA ligase, partial [Planctomycetota bacterium]|nr:arginine--tRNA ligase [Planctomycetota bacterium]
MNIRRELERRLSAALSKTAGVEGLPAIVAPSARPRFGDYQANGVMSAAKRLKINPRELADKVIATVDLSDLAENLEAAGPGFINITLKDELLQKQLAESLTDEHLGVPKADPSQRIVVDYSAPNLAKEMHVGHLRSTIIGDALVRTLDFLGHTVIRQNHVGDWGTQFGMLIAYHEDGVQTIPDRVITKTTETVTVDGDKHRITEEVTRRPHIVSFHVADMEEFYRSAKVKFDTDAGFADKSRKMVARLQGGDSAIKQKWCLCRDESLRHCQQVYDRLGVLLTSEDVRGESAYNDDLPEVVRVLKDKELLTESEGAQCVFLDEFRNKDNEPLPVIVQKSDGGYLYSTTDLAAVRYRVGELKAERILYVTDSRQALHFKQIFAVARKAGFAPENVSLEHIPFGTMMGSDNRPFKTREGGTVKLTDLLDIAERQALGLVNSKNPDLPDEQKREIARIVGIGAVKYADLSHNRTSDYVFSFDKMLSLDGNTAPYMQYAYARIRSIFRKGNESTNFTNYTNILITDPSERALALKLLQFAETVEAVAAESLPHLLCGYLYDLAGVFTAFYESCP